MRGGGGRANLAGMRAAGCVAVLVFGVGGVANAQPPNAQPPPAEAPLVPRPKPREIEIEIPGERSTANIVTLAAIAGAGAIVGGIGVYFNLDARSAQQDVEANKFTAKPWTEVQVALVERADRSSTRAGIAYGVGGALLIGATVAFIITAPKSETSVIRTTSATPTIAPAPGGAVLGGAWRF